MMKTKLLKIFLGLLCTVWFQSSLAIIPPEERAALITFYYATNGESWKNSENWLGGEGAECRWLGVSCNSTGDHVTGIYLGYKNTTGGTIPSELSQLSQLKLLSIASNYLTGIIPPELGKLSQLKTLDLGNNKLTGIIPPELGKLSQLKTLDLGKNKLTGIIPPELGKLSQLKTLALGNNKLTGIIPPELGQLSQLTVLQLFNNQLEGTIPPELGMLSQLVGLDLRYNQLTGNIPIDLGKLSQLNFVDLNTNKLTGIVPPKLKQLLPFPPKIPAQLGPSKNWLDVMNNCLIGTIHQQVHCANLALTVADYNAEESRLIVGDAIVGNQHFSVTLRNIGNYQFSLTSVVYVGEGFHENPAVSSAFFGWAFHATPAIYDLNTLQVTIPTVSALGAFYEVILQYDPVQDLFLLINATLI